MDGAMYHTVGFRGHGLLKRKMVAPWIIRLILNDRQQARSGYGVQYTQLNDDEESSVLEEGADRNIRKDTASDDPRLLFQKFESTSGYRVYEKSLTDFPKRILRNSNN